MKEINDFTKALSQRSMSIIILILSSLVFLFYFATVGLQVDVYKYAFVGAIFELFSLPMLGLLIILPILCLIKLILIKTGKAFALVAPAPAAFDSFI